MSSFNPYLFFNGNCRAAMEFYARTFGGDLNVMTYDQAGDEGCPAAKKGKVMHAMLRKGDLVLMASDTSDDDADRGDNVQININCDSLQELETWFKALSENGKVHQPLGDMFWGARFGALTDQYGVSWMLNFYKQQAKG